MERIARLIEENDFKSFENLYNDFKDRAVEDYKFELAPLEYADFVDVNSAVSDGDSCLVYDKDGVFRAIYCYQIKLQAWKAEISRKLSMKQCLHQLIFTSGIQNL